MDQNPTKNKNQTLCTFLSSSMNAELVYAILVGVSEFVRERQFSSQTTREVGSVSSNPSVGVMRPTLKRTITKTDSMFDDVAPMELLLPYIRINQPRKFWESNAGG
jgi:hypothetical protein